MANSQLFIPFIIIDAQNLHKKFIWMNLKKKLLEFISVKLPMCDKFAKY